MLQTGTCTFTEVSIINYNTRRFIFELGQDAIHFEPGQFITLDLPIHEKKNKRLRSYSIASAPSGTNKVELIIVLLPGGLGTEYLFNQAQIGTQYEYRGPAGHFILPNPMPPQLYMICTGTGIAPFLSMLYYLQATQQLNTAITLIFGTRTQADLLEAEQLQALQQANAHFKYIPVLSREDWAGAQGYVHAVYTQLCQGQPDAHFMLCGWRAMIDEAREKLTALGYSKAQVHYELYG
jgi:ferredoxin-NADP reductase